MTFHKYDTPHSKRYNPQTRHLSQNKPQKTINQTQQINSDRIYEIIQNQKQQGFLSLLKQPELLICLAKDNLQVAKLKQIMYIDRMSKQYRQIKLQESQLLDIERLTRLKTIYNLQKSKSLNLIIIRSIGQYLQDILSSNFKTLHIIGNNQSKILLQLYTTINRINERIVQLKNNTKPMQTLVVNELSTLRQQNRRLKEDLSKSELDLSIAKQKIVKILSESSLLKKQLALQQNFNLNLKQSMLQLKKYHISLLYQKEALYQQQLKHLNSYNKMKQTTLQVFYEEMKYSIEDFKSLIRKLNTENKILKQQKQLLLSKIEHINFKILQFINKLNQLKESCPQKGKNLQQGQYVKGKQDYPQGQDFKGQAGQQGEFVTKLNQEIDNFTVEMMQKDKMIQQMQILQLKQKNKPKQLMDNNMILIEELRKQQNKQLKQLQNTVQELKNHLFQQKSKQQQKIISVNIQIFNQNHEHIQSMNNLQLQNKDRGKDSKDKDRGNNGAEKDRQILKLKQKMQRVQRQLRQADETIRSLNQIVQDLHQFYKKQTTKPQFLINNDQLLSLKQKNRQKQIQLTTKSDEIKLKQNKINEQQNQIKQKQILLAKQQKQLHLKQDLIKQKQLQVYNLNQQISKLIIQLNDERTKVKEVIRQQILQTDGQSEINFMQKEKNVLQQERQVVQMQDRISVLQKQMEIKDEQLRDHINQLDSLQKMLQFTKNRSKENELMAKNAQKKYKTLITSKQFKEKHPQISIDILFIGDLLECNPEEKLFLKNIIQAKVKKSIRKTKLLWHLDPLNNTNYHQYIDHKQNFVVIIKLINGLIIGGFSEGKLYPKMIANKDAIIFSLSKRQSFDLQEPGKKAIAYDDYYIIFGNSQLRLKFQDMKFFSNFGISNSYYRSRGYKVDVLTGSLQREIELQNIQIHEILFY